MKKTLVILLMLYLSTSLVQAKIPEDGMNRPPMAPKMSEQEQARREAFEKRLNLTEEQKQKSKELRLEGREKMKPVMDKIRAKENEARMIKNSNTEDQAQTEKLNAINLELRTLHKQAHDIRIENMKSFEDILTTDQKKTLKEMRQEGRHEYDRKHVMPPQQNFKK